MNTKTINLDELTKLSGGDEKFFVEMVDIFIRTTEDGMNEIDLAIKKKNFKLVTDLAHRMSSPCLHLGATELYTRIKKIELDLRESKKSIDPEQMATEARKVMEITISDLKTEMEKRKPSG